MHRCANRAVVSLNCSTAGHVPDSTRPTGTEPHGGRRHGGAKTYEGRGHPRAPSAAATRDGQHGSDRARSDLDDVVLFVVPTRPLGNPVLPTGKQDDPER